jgi:hypothetical protein
MILDTLGDADMTTDDITPRILGSGDAGCPLWTVPLLTDSLPVAKRALPGRSRCLALTWSDVSSCWDVAPLRL